MSNTIRKRRGISRNWHVESNFDLSHYRPWSRLSDRWTEESLLADHCQRRYGHTDVDKARNTAIAKFHSDNFRLYSMGSVPRSYRREAERMLRAATRQSFARMRKLACVEDIGDVETPNKRILKMAAWWYW